MPTKRIPFSRRYRSHLVLVFVLLALFAAGGIASWRIEKSLDMKAGETSTAQVSKQDYYKSLDLGLARQAVYTNQAVSYVHDLGVTNGVKQAVISFKVPKDHLTEYGLMTLPNQPAPAGGYPVLILCHGYANPKTYSTTKYYLPDMEFYSRNSFAVIKPDFRGQGLSRSSGTPDGAFYSMAYNTDVMSLIAAIKQTSYLNKNSISIWGHSMGAYIALRAAVVSPDIKNVILLSTPVDNARKLFSRIAVSDRSNTSAKSIKDYMLQKYGNPYSNPGFWDSASPMNYLKDTNAFIQIHVGASDRVVPPQYSADLNSALEKLKKPHQYFVYPHGSHGLVSERELIWQRSLKVLKNH